jgi:hypothetical protein
LVVQGNRSNSQAFSRDSDRKTRGRLVLAKISIMYSNESFFFSLESTSWNMLVGLSPDATVSAGSSSLRKITFGDLGFDISIDCKFSII